MNKNLNRQFDPNVLAVLHKTGRVWRAVIARAAAKGPGKPRLLAHREFSQAEHSRMAAWIDEHDAGQISVVLHASSVICRTCSLPDAPQDQLGPALRLQAEAHLFGIAPSHRLGMAVLEGAPGETSRSGIVLAWPEHRPGNGTASDSHRPPITKEQLAGREILYTPDVASLASLLNGTRPTQPLAWVDREDGSLALAVTHANGAVFRGLSEDASDSDSWTKSVSGVLAETCMSVGHTAAFIETLVRSMRERMGGIGEGEARLISPPEVIESAKERLENAPTDERWWASYGIAAGVVLARSSELAALTGLRESIPVKVATTVDRAVTALSTRKAAAVAVAACLAVLMFAPLVVNGARLAILRVKYPDTQLLEQIADVRTINNQLVIYRELDRNSWSMTKVLSDIVNNTPQGIELEHVRVSPQRMFNIQGRVIPHGGLSATEIVGVMRQNLDDTGIFRDTSLQWRDPDAFGNYQFNLSASIARPYWKFEYPEDRDFAVKTLAERLYGPRAAPKPVETAVAEAPPVEEPQDDIAVVTGMLAEVITGVREPDEGDIEALRAGAEHYGEEYDDHAWEDEDEYDPRGARPSRPTMDRTRAPVRDTASGRPSAPDAYGVDQRGDTPASSPDFEIPPPMTREQIQAMSDSEVMDMLSRVATARQRAQARQDEELTARLRQEFDWLMDRRRNPR